VTDLSNDGAAPGAETRRQVVINAQYVKDLSFENPRAPQSLLQQQQPDINPELHLSVDVKAQTLAPDVYEVVLNIKAETVLSGDIIFVAELAYGAVVTLVNTPQEEAPQALMVETPRQIFPFVRNILADVTRDGGFQPLLINPIDFAEVYRRRIAEQQGTDPATA
jgi:preprotein translocase subunit SecB